MASKPQWMLRPHWNVGNVSSLSHRGCSRSGKSTLANRFLERKRIPLLSTDVLDAAFQDLGEIPSNINDQGQRSNQVVQQLLEPMIARTIAGHAPYCFEGIHLSPEFIARMIRQHGRKICLCVLGFPSISIDTKMKQVEIGSIHTTDWLLPRSAEYQRAYLCKQREISQQMKTQCLALGIPFVDTGRNFERSVGNAFSCLTQGYQA